MLDGVILFVLASLNEHHKTCSMNVGMEEVSRNWFNFYKVNETFIAFNKLYRIIVTCSVQFTSE